MKQPESPVGAATTAATVSNTANTLKYVSLVVMLVQNAFTPLIFRYAATSETEEEHYDRSIAVMCAEFFKLIASVVLICMEEEYSLSKGLSVIYHKVLRQPRDTIKLAVPAVLYFVQNVLVQFASGNLPAALFQVSYQGRSLVVAFCSVILLQKQLTRVKWLAIFLMAAGIATVEMADPKETKQGQMANAKEQNITLGLIYVFLGCLCSGFAGVYFEMMIKMGNESERPSMWVRNFQLALFSFSLGLMAQAIFFVQAVTNDDLEDFISGGPFYGFNSKVWLMVANSAFGGLCVALVIKYADNILRGFATALATIVSALVSVPLFGFQLTLLFFLGMMVVILSTLLYGDTIAVKGEFWNSEPDLCKNVRSASSPQQPTEEATEEFDKLLEEELENQKNVHATTAVTRNGSQSRLQ